MSVEEIQKFYELIGLGTQNERDEFNKFAKLPDCELHYELEILPGTFRRGEHGEG